MYNQDGIQSNRIKSGWRTKWQFTIAIRKEYNRRIRGKHWYERKMRQDLEELITCKQWPIVRLCNCCRQQNSTNGNDNDNVPSFSDGPHCIRDRSTGTGNCPARRPSCCNDVQWCPDNRHRVVPRRSWENVHRRVNQSRGCDGQTAGLCYYFRPHCPVETDRPRRLDWNVPSIRIQLDGIPVRLSSTSSSRNCRTFRGICTESPNWLPPPLIFIFGVSNQKSHCHY